MKPTKFITLILLTLLTLFSAQAKKQKRPNVIMIYTDDHRFSGIHALGGMQVKTPNIDKLAADGVSFNNTYLMGAFSGATCAPSRAMLLTGQQLFQLKGRGHTMAENHVTMGQAFRNAGYHSHIVGKWHQQRPELFRSFDSGDKLMGIGVYLVDHYRMPFWDWDKTGKFAKEDAYLIQFNENGKRYKRPITKTDKRGPTATEKDGPHTSEIFAENAINFINNYNDKKKPYFMYLAFHAPHDPRQAPQEYRDMYPPESIELTPSYMPIHPFDNGHIVLRDEQLAPWPRTPEIARQQLADYYAIITHLDAQIGKVIEALKENGDYENTLIVLSGDSGLGVGNHGLLGKQNVYDEDGIHVPFIMSGNLIKQKGETRDAFCYIHDIFPTICDFVNIPVPDGVDGKSQVPVLNNEVKTTRNYTYHAYMHYQRAYRKGDYKLIEYVKAPNTDRKGNTEIRGSRVTQLFNIKEDKWETTNLAYFPEYKQLLTEMKTEMKAKGVELGDKGVDGYPANFWEFYHE